jgi:uncharacterized membrane protein
MPHFKNPLNIPTFPPSLIFIILIAAGTVLRLSNLDVPVYWGDEVYSSIRIFGHTTAEIRDTIAQGQIVTAAILQNFQQSNADHSLLRTIASIHQEDRHIAPLYFLLARLWSNGFGDSIGVIRGFSATLGFLTLPAIYLLSLELFQEQRQSSQIFVERIAKWAALMLAISPLQLLIAREARMYSLWELTTLLSSWLLLRALRRDRWGDWGWFAIALTMLFYSHFLALMIGLGYVAYVMVIHFRDRQILQRFGLAAVASGLSFAPWFWFFLTRSIVDNRDEEGTIGSTNLRLMIRNLFALVRRTFIDFNTTPATSKFWAIGLSLVSVIGLLLIVYAAWRLWRSQRRSFFFLTCLASPSLLCMMPQLMQGLLPERYVLPTYLAISLTLAHFCAATQRPRFGRGHWQAWQWPIVISLIVTIGLMSCGQAVQAQQWWNKYFSNCNPAIAQIVNQSPRPLIIGDGTGGVFFDHGLSNLLALSHYLKPDVSLQIGLETQPIVAIANDGYSDRFVVTPSAILRDQLNQRFPNQLQPLLTLENPYRGSAVCLWKLPT